MKSITIPLPDPAWLLLLLIPAIVFAPQVGGCPTIGGNPPPFKTDKLSVLVVEETVERRKYTPDQRNIVDATDAKSIKAQIETAGGMFHKIDDDVPADKLAMSPKWVQDAFAVPRQSVPWVVGASPRGGFSVPLTTEADLQKRIAGIK